MRKVCCKWFVWHLQADERYITNLQILGPEEQCPSYLIPSIQQRFPILLTDNKTIKNRVTSTTMEIKSYHCWCAINS